MSRKFAGRADRTFSWPQIINGTNVIKTTTRNKVAWGSISTGHDPRWTKWNRLDLVGSVSIPNNKFAILRCWYQMSFICWPVHWVYFREMPLQYAANFHDNTGEWFDFFCHLTYWEDDLMLALGGWCCKRRGETLTSSICQSIFLLFDFLLQWLGFPSSCSYSLSNVWVIVHYKFKPKWEERVGGSEGGEDKGNQVSWWALWHLSTKISNMDISMLWTSTLRYQTNLTKLFRSNHFRLAFSNGRIMETLC